MPTPLSAATGTYPQVCSRLEDLMRAEREMEAAMRAMRLRRMTRQHQRMGGGVDRESFSP